MSRHHRRSARREAQTGEAFNTERVHRRIGESAPDVLPVKLPSGATLQAEVKERARPLRTFARWLAQCDRYCTPDMIAALVVYATGQHRDEALVVLRMRDFRRAVGLTKNDAQLALPFGGVR